MKHPSMQQFPTWHVQIVIPVESGINETHLWDQARFADEATANCVTRYCEAAKITELPEGTIVRTRRMVGR